MLHNRFIADAAFDAISFPNLGFKMKARYWPNSDDHVREKYPPYFVASLLRRLYSSSAAPQNVSHQGLIQFCRKKTSPFYMVMLTLRMSLRMPLCILLKLIYGSTLAKIKRAAHKCTNFTAEASLVQTFRYCFHLQNVSIEATVQIAATTSASRWQVLISRVLWQQLDRLRCLCG